MAAISFDDRSGFIWFDGKSIPWREAKLHVLSHGLHYGSCVFDGDRAYSGVIFKSKEHSERFRRSAEMLDFKIPYSTEEIEFAKAELLQLNGGGSQYVRSVAWRGSEMMALGAQYTTIHVAIATWEWPSMFDPSSKMNGITLDIADYRRPDPATMPVRSKAAGLYMIGTISKHRAEERGCADALMLDWQGRVAECTGANVMFSRDGVIHTPIADCFLDGITRRTVIDLARRRGVEVVERRIMPHELPTFDECFICGTAAEVTPVRRIASHGFVPGEISRVLMEDYATEVAGKVHAIGQSAASKGVPDHGGGAGREACLSSACQRCVLGRRAIPDDETRAGEPG
jgi:branched-chain amino acid aminotransferase